MSQINQLFSLKGKTALVTGSTGYLGEAIAFAMGGAGAKVLVNSRDLNRAQWVVERLQQAGYLAEPMVFDVTEDDQVTNALVHRDGEPLHVLVNNAYSGIGGTVQTSEAVQYRDSYEVVVTAAQRLLKAGLPALREAVKRDGDASVINIASMYGMVSPDPRLYDAPESNNPPFYCAAKAALIQWTRYAACELGPERIRVNSISPGPFPAPSVVESAPAFVERLAGRVPLGRVGRADELQGPLLFLASSAASFVNGSNLVVDGGWTAW